MGNAGQQLCPMAPAGGSVFRGCRIALDVVNLRTFWGWQVCDSCQTRQEAPRLLRVERCAPDIKSSFPQHLDFIDRTAARGQGGR